MGIRPPGERLDVNHNRDPSSASSDAQKEDMVDSAADVEFMLFSLWVASLVFVIYALAYYLDNW